MSAESGSEPATRAFGGPPVVAISRSALTNDTKGRPCQSALDGRGQHEHTPALGSVALHEPERERARQLNQGDALHLSVAEEAVEPLPPLGGEERADLRRQVFADRLGLDDLLGLLGGKDVVEGTDLGDHLVQRGTRRLLSEPSADGVSLRLRVGKDGGGREVLAEQCIHLAAPVALPCYPRVLAAQPSEVELDLVDPERADLRDGERGESTPSATTGAAWRCTKRAVPRRICVSRFGRRAAAPCRRATR